MQSLAVVELQLVMQSLDHRSLLALARCSRTLLAAASHPFAWKRAVVNLCCAGSEPSPPERSLLARLRGWMKGARAPAAPGEGRRNFGSVVPPDPSPLTMARRCNTSLLRFGGCVVRWALTSSAAELHAQLAEVAVMPRISALVIDTAQGQLLSPANVALLADGLLHHSAATLTLLNLCRNRLGDVGAVAVAELVREAARLRTLLLDNTQIGAAGWRALGEAVAQSSSLAVLSLNNTPAAGDAGALAIAGALAASMSLQRVSLSKCGIGDVGAEALAGALRGQQPSSRLEALNLGHNFIGDDGATALVDAVLSSWVPCGRDSLSGTRRVTFFLALLSNLRISVAVRTRVVLPLCSLRPCALQGRLPTEAELLGDELL